MDDPHTKPAPAPAPPPILDYASPPPPPDRRHPLPVTVLITANALLAFFQILLGLLNLSGSLILSSLQITSGLLLCIAVFARLSRTPPAFRSAFVLVLLTCATLTVIAILAHLQAQRIIASQVQDARLADPTARVVLVYAPEQGWFLRGTAIASALASGTLATYLAIQSLRQSPNTANRE